MNLRLVATARSKRDFWICFDYIAHNTREMPSIHHFGLLADGYQRARAAAEQHVRRQVEREFADRISIASPAEERQLRVEMDILIAKRIGKLAPPDALY